MCVCVCACVYSCIFSAPYYTVTCHLWPVRLWHICVCVYSCIFSAPYYTVICGLSDSTIFVSVCVCILAYFLRRIILSPVTCGLSGSDIFVCVCILAYFLRRIILSSVACPTLLYLCLCVCVFLHLFCAVLYCHLWPVRLYYICVCVCVCILASFLRRIILSSVACPALPYLCVCILASFLRRIILSSVTCPALPYFSTLSHKRHDFRQKVTENKMRVLIFSTASVRNTSHSKKNSARYDNISCS